MAIAQLLRKDYQEKEREMNSSRDEYFRTRRMAELESEKAYIEEVVRDNDLTFNTTVVFSIYADIIY